MFLIAIIIIVGHCIAGQFIFSYNELDYVQQHFGVLLKQDPFYAMDMPVFTVLDKVCIFVGFWELGLIFQSNPIVIAHFLSNSSILMGSYLIVLICSYKILHELRRCNKSMSRTTREMNKQLSLLLFIQVSFLVENVYGWFWC